MLFPCCPFSLGPLADKKKIYIISQGDRVILKEEAVG